MRGSCLGHERQAVPHEPLADGLRVQLRGGDALRPLPDHIDRKLQRPLELFLSDREQQRKHRIAQQPGFDNIRARNAEVGQRRLKGRAVPERDRNRFL